VIDRSAGHQDIVDDCEDTFAANPGTILVSDATIVQHGSFVKIDASAMNFFGKDNLISMEVVPA
jgi:hypothetical protein